MSDIITTVSLPDELLFRLREKSVKEDRSVSSIVRLAVREFLQKEHE